VVVEEGKLTVDVHHAELESVLREIATRAAFDLRTSGKLGRVTATFAGVSLEEGLRRLAPGHELMLVYRAPVGPSAQALVEVRVFAASPPSDPRRAAADLAEINRLLRTGAGPEGIARLVDLLGAAPEPAVRSRAAAVLGWRGGIGSEAALTEALNDPAPDVRIQVVDALRRVAGARAIPALQLLLRDPDAVVRRAAARSLGMLPEAAATSALTAATGDPDASVRKEVIWALRRRGVLDP
jgi:HEAT repeat protein